MAPQGADGATLIRRAFTGPALLTAAVLAGAGWAVLSAGQTVATAGSETLQALWLLPGLVCLHLVQLMLSTQAWRMLLPVPVAGWGRYLRLRLVREGIDSLLPVAQVGGELVGARLLARPGLPLALAAASVVVDVTMEFLTQLAFLVGGLVLWSLLVPGGALAAGRWVGIGLLAAMAAGAMLAAQRFGILRLLEGLMRQVAARLPALPAAPLDGLHDAAAGLYRRRMALAGAGSLHLLAWLLGTAESWAVLNALGFAVPWPAALVVESLGMAGRSAGFAIPGALVVQETGFVLAAMAMGLPESAGLALSLVKRAREVTTGLLGLALWKRGERVVEV